MTAGNRKHPYRLNNQNHVRRDESMAAIKLLALLVTAVVLVISAYNADVVKEQLNPKVIEDSPSHIMETRSDCWAPTDWPTDVTGDPGSVVMSGGEFHRPALVHRAAEQVLFGEDHGLVIYGFCH